MYQGKSYIFDKFSIDNEHIICNKCKKTRTCCKEEISKLNPNRYYKLCISCRAVQNNYNINFRKKNNLE